MITGMAAADHSESTTILVSKGLGLPRVLQQAFEDGACPAPLALLAQVLRHAAAVPRFWARPAGVANRYMPVNPTGT